MPHTGLALGALRCKAEWFSIKPTAAGLQIYWCQGRYKSLCHRILFSVLATMIIVVFFLFIL